MHAEHIIIDGQETTDIVWIRVKDDRGKTSRSCCRLNAAGKEKTRRSCIMKREYKKSDNKTNCRGIIWQYFGFLLFSWHHSRLLTGINDGNKLKERIVLAYLQQHQQSPHNNYK